MDLLFYELASEDRLAILRELCSSSLKMQDIARKLDLTATEASRQLTRLSQAKMLKRGSEGAYDTTQLGRLILTLSASMEFVYNHDDYFFNHNLAQIPLPFINRIGELSEGVLVVDLIGALAKWEALVVGAQEYLWVMTPRPMEHLTRHSVVKLSEGIKIRSIMSEENREAKISLPYSRSAERKLLDVVPIVMLISEKEASVSFPSIPNNGADFTSSFFGSDKAFLIWTKDLFHYYWEKGKTWYQIPK